MKIIRQMMRCLYLTKDISRPQTEQAIVDKALAYLKLYQTTSCPFCFKVRRRARQLNLTLETRNIDNPLWEKELIEKGGKRMVPCLRIEENNNIRWLYESDDIIAYLEKNFHPTNQI